MSLQCPHCEWIWRPRVNNPKACPRCKRHFRNELPVPVDQETLQDWIGIQKEITIEETHVQYQCPLCNEEGEDEEAPYIWMNMHYCLRHTIELLLTYDAGHEYKKSDPFGKLEDEREHLRTRIFESLRLEKDIVA